MSAFTRAQIPMHPNNNISHDGACANESWARK